jgi:hypothetical protein
MTTVELTDREAEFVLEAIREFKRLRGWAWDGDEDKTARDVVEAFGENSDNFFDGGW